MGRVGQVPLIGTPAKATPEPPSSGGFVVPRVARIGASAGADHTPFGAIAGPIAPVMVPKRARFHTREGAIAGTGGMHGLGAQHASAKRASAARYVQTRAGACTCTACTRSHTL